MGPRQDRDRPPQAGGGSPHRLHPAAVSTFTRKRPLAEEFIQFLTQTEAKEIFRKHGYLMSVEEARAYTLPGTPVGGEFVLPGSWKRKGK